METQTHTPNQTFRLGTRRSPLAMAQAEEARDRLARAHGIDPAHIEIVAVTASGDRIQDRALAEIGGKALWTKELDAWLAAGEIDFAVHSAKDVETLRPAQFAIGAVLERADVRDVLIGAESIAALPQGAVVGTSAPRRAAQLLHARPDCTVVTFRGNVATRLAKLAAGEADATFLAAAGLARLGEHGTGHPLDEERWLPAPGQAAILIECRADDARTRDFLSAIDDAPSRATVLAERALLAGLGGNCHSPIAVLTRAEGDQLAMRAALYSPDGAEHVEGEARFAAGDMQGPANLAADLLARAVPAIAVHFGGPGG
ncbi:hydroxymethylbilane synthase [Novosphingobium mangrovi (ex Huang et al. 2023)]|uniref:Porphobilinogen deaminase n=1 Tax=Novosphingobium mangrovi (ex Huang et al. 2023) TaxID=2976432 RepID=A0ABT2I015_9SPHN|nr:hydroxymethylbilane synthase [Novosphingobium mangrovi (ex Huang et al. 2023)]MCT2398134.1 hydroxymethylbilane synthase [Novosphingobium mangrovi (ex Huang et al. 2023)]